MDRRGLVLLVRELEALLPLAIQPATRAVLRGAVAESRRLIELMDDSQFGKAVLFNDYNGAFRVLVEWHRQGAQKPGV